ncbi:hypothetical protein ACF09J_32680 [Streptomyces sp. NPDC014889]
MHTGNSYQPLNKFSSRVGECDSMPGARIALSGKQGSVLTTWPSEV